jgi:hypothetical protein
MYYFHGETMKVVKSKIYLILILSSICLLHCGKVSYSRFTVGTKNSSSETLRNVALKMRPEGFDEPGILTPSQKKTYMYPRWSVPKEIDLTFKDSKNRSHTFKLKTNLPKDFSGDISVIIEKENGRFCAEIKTGKLGELN